MSDTATRRAEPDPLLDALVQVTFVVMGVLNRIGAENGLSLTQLRVLAILRDRRLRMTTLADYLGLDKSTLTGLVDRAEQRKLLRRARNPADGRAVDVLISAAGTRLADRLYAQVATAVRPLTGALSDADRRRLQTVLERMLTAPGVRVLNQ